MFFIVLNAKNAKITIDEIVQMLLIYEHIDGYLKCDLPRTSPLFTVSGFIEKFRH